MPGDEERSGHLPSRGDTAIKVVLSLVPYVGGSLAVLYDDVMTRRRYSVDSYVEAAFSVFPGGEEALLGRLTGDRRLAELFVKSAEAAATTSVAGKAAALGRLLATAGSAPSDHETDMAELLTLVLIDLEWPHVRTLAHLARFPSDGELYKEYGDERSEEVTADNRRKERLRAVALIPPPVLAALLRHGLISQASGYGLYVEGVTAFGRDLLSYIQAEAPDSRAE